MESVIAHPVRAVLFDMTGTLHPQAVMATASRASLGVLLRDQPGVTPEQAGQAVRMAMMGQFAAGLPGSFYLMRDLMATGYREAFASIGVELGDAVLAEATAAFMGAMVDHVELYPGVLDVLQTLRAAGIATGVVSVNDEAPLQAMVDATGLRPHLDVVVSSEAARSCKPDPVIFEVALGTLGVTAAETVFVGDMPEMDIVGARRVGMRTVLTTEDQSFIGTLQDVGPDGQADHTIARIVDLLDVLGLA